MRLEQEFTWQSRHPQTFGRAETVDQALNAILLNRGYTPADLPSFRHLPIPSPETAGVDELGIRLLAKRIIEAGARNERVLIFGDSDADGTIGTAITYALLRSFGLKEVAALNPSRDAHGYGFEVPYAQEYAGKYPLIITVDCGLTNNESISLAKDGGSDVVVIDHHHLQEETFPTAASAVIYTPQTSAAGIAYLLSKHFEKTLGLTIPEMVSDAAVAVIADYEPMTRINRAIVREGLKQLRRNPPRRYRHLVNSKWSLPQITARDLGFTLAPILNSPCRTGDGTGNLSTRFHLADIQEKTDAELEEIVRQLRQRSAIRKDNTAKLMEQVGKELESEAQKNHILCLIDKPLPQNAFGPLATRLAFQYGLPAFIGVKQGQQCVLEGRSPRSADLMPIVEAARPYMIRGGGHTGAIGLTIPQENLPQLQTFMESFFNTLPETRRTAKSVDCEIPCHLIPELWRHQGTLGPFGPGNEQPILITRRLGVKNVTPLPKEGPKKHLRLHLAGENLTISAIKFNVPPEQLEIRPGERVDTLYHLGSNTYNGVSVIQLELLDLRSPKDELVAIISPPVPEQSHSPRLSFPDSQTFIPESIALHLRQPQQLIAFDKDDTLQFLNPETTVLRFACFEAWHRTHDNYFPKVYPTVQKDTPQWDELQKRLGALSPQIVDNAQAYLGAWRTDDERGEIYRRALGYSTTKELWESYRRQFLPRLTRRVDEFPQIAPGAVSLLNYLGQTDVETAVISNSEAHELVDLEERLRQEGFTGRFNHLISAKSMGKPKPNPHSLRNLLLFSARHSEVQGIYVGNSVEDAQLTKNFSDINRFPSAHPIDYKRIAIIPVIITRGADYSSLQEQMPPHAEFPTLTDFEHYLRSVE